MLRGGSIYEDDATTWDGEQMRAAKAANKRRLGDECARAMDLGIRVNPALQRSVRGKTTQTEPDGEALGGQDDEVREGAANVPRREGGETQGNRKRKAEEMLDAWVERGEAKGPRRDGSHNGGESDCSDRSDRTSGEPS